MNNEPNKKEEFKKPEQTPADLQLNKTKKDIDVTRHPEEQIPPVKEFVKPSEKVSDTKTPPIN